MTAYAQQLLQAVEVPTDMAWENAGPIYALMVGAAASLIEAERCVPRPQKRPDWNEPSLLSLLKASAGNDAGPFRFSGDDGWVSWLAGFHLGSAMFRLSAAIDRGVNAWLLQYTNQNTRPRDEELLMTWISSRAFMLEHIIRAKKVSLRGATEAIEKLSELLEGFNRYGHTVESSRFIHDVTDSVCRVRERTGKSEEGDIERVLDTERITHAQCLAVIFADTNLYKHSVGGPTNTGSEAFEVRLALALRSLWFIGDLWQRMNAIERVT